MSGVSVIKVKDIEPFKNHPFIVEVDDSLRELAQSIKDNGLLNPVIVRVKDDENECTQASVNII